MPQREPEIEQINGACKNWFNVQRWVDISNQDYGVTWLTPDAPLVEVGGITANLIGSLPDPRAWIDHLKPTQTIYSWAMNNHWHNNYRTEQEGAMVFRFFICPHEGRFNAEDAARLGLEFSQPLLAVAQLGKSLNHSPLAQLSNPSVLITAFKPSEDGRARIVRLFGASGKPTRTELRWAVSAPKAIWLSDNSEKPLQKITGSIDVPAWGIVTLRADLPD
jgi:alpha-mannosidase